MGYKWLGESENLSEMEKYEEKVIGQLKETTPEQEKIKISTELQAIKEVGKYKHGLTKEVEANFIQFGDCALEFSDDLNKILLEENTVTLKKYLEHVKESISELFESDKNYRQLNKQSHPDYEKFKTLIWGGCFWFRKRNC